MWEVSADKLALRMGSSLKSSFLGNASRGDYLLEIDRKINVLGDVRVRCPGGWFTGAKGATDGFLSLSLLVCLN